MTRDNERLETALRYAGHGWPVFPLAAGSKVPLERSHGLLEATTDERQVVRWWDRNADRNIGLATGSPGPDVVDVDTHGERASGWAAWNKLIRADLVRDPQAAVQTPSRGLHAYFRGTSQPNGKLTKHAIDFRGRGGYVVAPGSLVDGKPYTVLQHQASDATVSFPAVRQLLEPQAERPPWTPRDGKGVAHLASWVGQLQEGNRDDGTWWAMWRAHQAGDTDTVREIGRAALSIGLTQRDVDRITRSAEEIASRPKAPEKEAG